LKLIRKIATEMWYFFKNKVTCDKLHLRLGRVYEKFRLPIQSLKRANLICRPLNNSFKRLTANKSFRAQDT